MAVTREYWSHMSGEYTRHLWITVGNFVSLVRDLNGTEIWEWPSRTCERRPFVAFRRWPPLHFPFQSITHTKPLSLHSVNFILDFVNFSETVNRRAYNYCWFCDVDFRFREMRSKFWVLISDFVSYGMLEGHHVCFSSLFVLLHFINIHAYNF